MRILKLGLLEVKTIRTLVGILLISIFVIGCDCQKEKKLRKQKKQLVEEFKQKHNLTTAQVKKLEQTLQALKMQGVENIKSVLEELKKIETDLRSSDNNKKKDALSKLNDKLKGMMEDFSPITSDTKAQDMTNDLIAIFENLKERTRLKEKKENEYEDDEEDEEEDKK